MSYESFVNQFHIPTQSLIIFPLFPFRMMLKSQTTTITKMSTQLKSSRRRRHTVVCASSLHRPPASPTFTSLHKTPRARHATMTTYHSNTMWRLSAPMVARISDVTDPIPARASICSAWTVLERIVITPLRNLRWLTTRMFRLCNRWRRAAAVWHSPHSGSLSSTTPRRQLTTSGSRNRKALSTRRSNIFRNITSSSILTTTLCLITLVSITKAIIPIRWAISKHLRSRNPCKRRPRSPSRQLQKTWTTRNNFIFNIRAGERISQWSRSLRRRSKIG